MESRLPAQEDYFFLAGMQPGALPENDVKTG